MKQIVKNQKLSIFDDVFPELTNIQVFFEHVRMDHPYSANGICGITKEYRHDIVYNNVVDDVFTYCKAIANLGFGCDWKDCILTCHSYPCGAQSSWEIHKNKATMYFFVQNTWKSTWGGEILIGQTPEEPNRPVLDTRWHNEHMSQFGTGVYAMPKTNRCIVIPGAEWHRIGQITAGAGDTSLLFFKILLS